MIRLRFRACWLPEEHNEFWTNVDSTRSLEQVKDLIEYFNEQQKQLADYYQFHLPKRSTKLKYLKAFINNCVLVPHSHVVEILRDNDIVEFRLETEAQNEWLWTNSAPTSKRKRSSNSDSNDLDNRLRTLAKPSEEKLPFTFQFGNKRGRPIPPRPQSMSFGSVSSLIPRQVKQQKKF